MSKKMIYLDNAANTCLDKEVVKAMSPYLKTRFCGNSHSPNACGAVADLAIDRSREAIAKAMDVSAEEIFFTSGATESNNWVITGLVLHELSKPKGMRRDHIVCSALEHASVLNVCKAAERLGFSVTYVYPRVCGRIMKSQIAKAIKPERTLLVCCMAVNNETGVANDVDAMAKLAHKNGARFLSDFTQALLVGGEDIRIGTKFPHLDYVTFSAHKIHGPTGVGCLVRRKDAPLYPLLNGGSQERGLRGGTHNTAGIVGLGKAIEILGRRSSSAKFNKLYEYLRKEIDEKLPNASFNAIPDHKNIVSLSMRDVTSLTHIAGVLSNYGICCSAGAACAVGDDGEEPSHVLSAMGLPGETIDSTVRISFSKYTTESDIDALVSALVKIGHDFPKEEN